MKIFFEKNLKTHLGKEEFRQMKKLKTISTCAILLLITSGYTNAKYRDSFISFEAKTNTTFSKKFINKKVYPASMTKILTAHIILRDIKNLKQKASISKKAWGYNFRHGSRMFLEPNTQVSIENLLKGLLVQSGNDAAIALAEFHSGSTEEFVKEMNKTAKSLGMNRSNFVNPNGRHNKKHFTTADDFRKLIIATLSTTPEIINFTTTKQFKYNEIIQYNRNKAIDYPNSIGLKTGYTPQSGYNLSSCFEEKNGYFCTIEFGAKNPNSRFTNSVKDKEKNFSGKKVFDIKPQTIRLHDEKETYTITIPNPYIRIISKDETVSTKALRTKRPAKNGSTQDIEIKIMADSWEDSIPATLKTEIQQNLPTRLPI